MASTKSDSELGPTLMTLRGFQWIYGVKEDPYALLLRAEDDNPHALGERARARGALFWSSAEAWVTAQHRLGKDLLDDLRLGLPRARPADAAEEQASYAWALPSLNDILPLDDAFLGLNRDDYGRVHRLIGSATGQEFNSVAAETCQREVDRLAGDFDLHADFAQKTAIAAVAGLLGVPQDEQERFARLCAGAATALDATVCPPRLRTARQLIASITGVRDLIAELTGDDPDRLAMGVLLAVVGVEVTTSLICNAVSALLDHPDEWARLRQNPGLAVSAVEETLRYAPPVRLQRLVALADVELASKQVTAGSDIVVLIEAADRDPGAHDDPDRFVIGRRAQHLSLHSGLHTGAIGPVARLHATAALTALALHMPEIRRTGTVLRRLRSPVTGGVLRFPVATS